MTFKPKQLDSEATKVFSETEVGTLLENIDDKLNLILETVAEIKVEQTAMGEKLDQNVPRSEFGPVERRVAALEAR